LKIVGVVSEYKEALEIEEIVKVFLIEQRILNLPSVKQNKHQENVNSNSIIFSEDNIGFSKNSNEKYLRSKVDPNFIPTFSVKGLF